MNKKQTSLNPSRSCCLQGGPIPDSVRKIAEELAPLCKALGDPTRLQIAALIALSDRPLCACEVEANFDLSQPTISHHLAVLRRTGLVRTERRGTWIYYQMDPGTVAGVRPLLELLQGSALGRSLS